MKKMFRALAFSVLGLAASAAAAEDYPNNTVRWVVPYTAGGGSDVATRVIADHISAKLGVPFVVENKPGAATIVAAQDVARAKPDGYTMLTAGQSTLTLNPTLYESLPYDPDTDFEPVTTFAELPVVLVVRDGFPETTLEDFLQSLKDNPDAYSYASVGHGSPHHLASELLVSQLDTSAIHIPYRGSPQGLQDIMGGEVDFMLADLAAAASLVRSGKVNSLGLPADKRNPAIPDVPTFAEQGVTDYLASSWQGVVMPGNTPAERVEKISVAINEALQDPEVIQKLQDLGIVPMGSTPAEFRQFIGEERDKWAQVIEERGVSVEQ